MNKLDVALRLLQLLNERKSINSRVVAENLNVSMRTAQRYLMELSILPCVIHQENGHIYSVNPDYKLKEALINKPDDINKNFEEVVRNKKLLDIKQNICLACGNRRDYFNNMVSAALLNNGNNNLNVINKLACLIAKHLKSGKCSFP